MPGLAAAKVQFQQNLTNGGYGAGSPARSIVEMQGQELWRSAMTDNSLMAAACRNFYSYGRNQGWHWVQTLNGNGADTQGTLGEPLLRGTVTATNCGGFNSSLRKLAQTILGLNNVTNAGASTLDTFITNPGTQVIDATWTGNVRTLTQDFSMLRAFFFSGHSWNRLGADHYDTTTNSLNFNGIDDLIWCKGTKPAMFSGRAWSLTVMRPPQPYGPPPYLCIATALLKKHRDLFPTSAQGYSGGVGVTRGFITWIPDLNRGWDTLLLVSRSHLPVAFRQAINYP
jgi:hypothetical protein